MSRVPVASFGQRAKAESLRQRLLGAGIQAEIQTEEDLTKHWLAAGREPLALLEVPAAHYDRARQLLHEWDVAEGGLGDAIHCPECKSLRVLYPQFTRKFFLPNLVMGVAASIGLVEKEYYCEECHFTWPHEGAKPHPERRQHMAPNYFIEDIEQTTAPGHPKPPEAHREAA
jgi:hypothetical protein